MPAVGFEPTPFRNGALSHRLRPLGQTVLYEIAAKKDFLLTSTTTPKRILGDFVKLLATQRRLEVYGDACGKRKHFLIVELAGRGALRKRNAQCTN